MFAMNEDLGDPNNVPSSPKIPQPADLQPQASGTRDKKRKTAEPPSPSEKVQSFPRLHLPCGFNSRNHFATSIQKSHGRKPTLPDLQVVLKYQEAFGEAARGVGETWKDVKELAPSVARRLASAYRTLVDIGKKYPKESTEKAEKAENHRLKERGDTSSGQQFKVLAWLLNVKFIPEADFPHDKPELLSHSQIRRNNDLACSLREVKVAFREIHPDGGRLEKCVCRGVVVCFFPAVEEKEECRYGNPLHGNHEIHQSQKHAAQIVYAGDLKTNDKITKDRRFS